LQHDLFLATRTFFLLQEKSILCREDSILRQEKRVQSLQENSFLAFQIISESDQSDVPVLQATLIKKKSVAIDRVSADVTDARQIQSDVPPTLKVP